MDAPAQRHPVEKRGLKVWFKALFALRYVASSGFRLLSERRIIFQASCNQNRSNVYHR